MGEEKAKTGELDDENSGCLGAIRPALGRHFRGEFYFTNSYLGVSEAQ
jgi:hypothetical protein